MAVILEDLIFRPAQLIDVADSKLICDANRDTLGFITRKVFEEATTKGQLHVAKLDGTTVGFIRFNHHVRGDETSVYDICVMEKHRDKGIGRGLIVGVTKESRDRRRCRIVLRCPEGASANSFYAHVGFSKVTVEPGKRRRLVKWQLALGDASCIS